MPDYIGRASFGQSPYIAHHLPMQGVVGHTIDRRVKWNSPFQGQVVHRPLLDFSKRGPGTRLTQFNFYTAKLLIQYTSNAIPGLSSGTAMHGV